MRAIGLLALLIGLFACSGTSSTGLFAGDAGSTGDGGSAVGSNANGSATVVPAGSCRFTLRGTDGASTSRSGKATARMNGSGNVIVRCAELAEGTEVLELHIGNGTYDGPRTYVLSSDHADGAAELQTSDERSFEPADGPSSGCRVDVTSPKEEWLAAGAVLTGAFECQKLAPRRAKGESSTIDLSSGAFSAPVH